MKPKSKGHVIATEGVLYYREDGTVKRLLKKWEDLVPFIGEKVPVVDGHPTKGIVGTADKIYTYAQIQQCKLGKKALCIERPQGDKIPKRRGYSIGFRYKPIMESGVHGDQEYDGIQKVLMIDHIALTDTPRNPEALATDSTEGLIYAYVGDDNEINITKVAHDSYREFEKTSPDEVKAMDTENYIEEIASLKAELATMKAEKIAVDTFAGEKSDLETEIAKLQEEIKVKNDAISHFESLEEERKKTEMMKTVEFLKENKVAIDELPNKDIAFLEGIKWAFENRKEEPSTGVDSTPAGEVRKFEVDGVDITWGSSTTHYAYDAEKDTMVLKPKPIGWGKK